MSRILGAGVGAALTLITAAAAALGAPRLAWALILGLGVAMLFYAALTPSVQAAPGGEPERAGVSLKKIVQHGGSGNTQIIVRGDQKGTINVSVDPSRSPTGRRVLRRSPADLTSFYDRTRTQVQADALAKTYLGKLMELKGYVQDVIGAAEAERYTVRLASQEGAPVDATLEFQTHLEDELPSLDVGEEIAVRGKISRIDADGIALVECEFAE